jgi:serine/threonine-protein kinase
MNGEYAPGDAIPETVYRIVRSLGEGGMGRVYEVEDMTLGKRYALKILSGLGPKSSAALVRMAVESRTLVKVAHPNIVNVFTAGVTPDGCFYYVMELLRGSSLGRLLETKGNLDLRFGIPIALATAGALERAHAKGVVHRDVKPDNIFVSAQSNRTSIIKLLDFGVAALLDNVRSIERDAGMMLGTPCYMAPEQQLGERATPAMDIWSLGVVLFEMVTGVTPFCGESLPELILAVHGQRPAPPLRELAPSVPPRLDRLVASMLEKDLKQRIASMSAVVSELRAILATCLT